MCGGFKFAFKCVISLSFRICYQACWNVAKIKFVLNSFIKRSYLEIPDLLKTLAVVLKLHEKSLQRCLLIFHLCCYLYSRGKIRWILRIFKFARISWICKSRKNFAEYFLLVCYGLFVFSTARIKIKNNKHLHTRYFPLPGTFFNFSQFFSFPFFRLHVL